MSENLPKAVCLILKNEEGKILGVSRKRLPGVVYDNDPHKDMGLIGGKKDPEDKTPEDAIRRECLEETGLEVTDLLLFDKFVWGGYQQHCFIGKAKGEIKYDEPHVVKWVDEEELFKGSFGEYNKTRFEKFRILIDNYEKSKI